MKQYTIGKKAAVIVLHQLCIILMEILISIH